jgi:uncharacterized protein
LSDPLTKFQELVRPLASYNGVALALSGGVDSSLVLFVAKKAIGERVLAITALAPFLAEGEKRLVEDVVKAIGAVHVAVAVDVLGDEYIRRNEKDRCLCTR